VLLYSRRGLLSALALLLALAGAQAVAADPAPAPAPADPKARQLFDDIIKAYKAVTAYADQGKFVFDLSDNGKAVSQSTPLKLTLVRPNKVDFDAGLVRMVSDGKTLTTTVVPFKKYITTDAPKTITFDTFRQGAVGSIVFGGPTAPPMLVLLNLLVGDDPNKLVAELNGVLKLGDSKNGPSVIIELAQGPDFELVVDPATKLLKSINLLVDPDTLAKSAAAGHKITIDKFGWEGGSVSTKAPAADAFAYEAPKDFKKVDSFAGARADGEEEKYAVKELVGKPAPNFTLTVLDGAKTRTIARSDLAGKVVMIDFWATWCGPCLKELPEVQKMIESYAKDKKEVVIVALSQDKEPADLQEVRKLVEKTLDEQKITLTGTNVGLVALDPSNTIGDAFGVEAIPTLVILDPKGTVQAAYVGQQTGETLSKDIDALLQGKSLLKPKADEAVKKDGGK
jgi:thiol-disulfide isomerase/thioredoxin